MGKIAVLPSDTLVSVEWLHANNSVENLILLDASIPKAGNTTLATKERIPNALFFDLKKTFSDTSSAFPNTMLAPKILEGKLQDIGLSNDSIVVVYDCYGIYSAARVWWMLRAIGFSKVAVLDGGLPQWKKAGYTTSSEYKKVPQKGDFKSKEVPPLFCNKAFTFAQLHKPTHTIIDARSADRFSGLVPEPREGLRAGHIPSAHNIPYASLLEDGEKMKADANLSEIFAPFAQGQNPVILSCGSGVTACIIALALTRLGKEAIVYDGSWAEWGSDLDLPIETL